MSEQQTSETPTSPEQASPPPALPIGWMLFDKHPVLIQVKEPYIGVLYPAEPMTDPQGRWRVSAILRGILQVLPNGDGGVMLVMHIPDPNTKTVSHVTVYPEDVRYCTFVEQIEEQRIVAP